MIAARVEQLARQMRLSRLDVVGLMRDAAGDPDVMELADLTMPQQQCLVAVMEVMAEPCIVRRAVPFAA